MVPTVKCILFTVAAYLFGSIPVGLIICQIWAGIDIREYGSRNIGMTNVYRVLKNSHGHLPWLMTFTLDFAKGYLPVYLAFRWLSTKTGMDPLFSYYIALVVLAVMIGNLYPIYTYFRGGKGIATGLGVFTALMGFYVLIPLMAFLVLMIISRMVSIGSLAGAVTMPITFFLMGKNGWGIFNRENPDIPTPSPEVFVVFTVIITAFIIYKHKSNIQRIISGTERKLWSRKSSGEETHPQPPEPGEVEADGG